MGSMVVRRHFRSQESQNMIDSEGVKHVETKTMPAHWRTARLGDYCSIQNGFPFKSSNFDEKRGTPLIRVRSLKTQACDVRYNGDFDESYVINDGDIIIGMDGDFQPCLWMGGKALLNQRVCRLIDFSDYVYPYYIFQAIKMPLGEIERSTFYTTVKHLSSYKIQEIRIPLPPLPEQHAIAQALRAVQEAKAARQREMVLEQERKAALLQHFFSHGARSESTQESAFGDIPQSWKVAKLKDIATLHRGRDLPVQNRVAGSIPVIGSNGVTDWHNEYPEEVPVPGVCTGRSGSIGLLTYIDRPYWPLNTVLYVSDFHGNAPLFIYYWLQLFNFKKYSQGVSVPTLNRNLVHPVLFPLPSISEQYEIAHILKSCDEKITTLERETRLLSELFKAMLEELMTGRLSSKPLTEVATS